jgi:hypothetical protein
MKGRIGKREKEYQVKKKYMNGEPSIFAAFLIGLLSWLSLLFYPEDGGDMFLRNIALSPSYTAL